MYLTYHLKTIDYFYDISTLYKYWDTIDSLLTQLEKEGENSVTKHIENTVGVRLTAAQRIQFGHVLPVSIGYPILNNYAVGDVVQRIIEYPNTILSNMKRSMVRAFHLRNRCIIDNSQSTYG